MKTNTLIKLLVFVSFITLGFMLTSSAKAAAYSLCGVLAPPVQTSTPPSNSDCLTYGQDYSTQTIEDGVNLSTATSAQLESAFITNLDGYYNDGGFQEVGAQYIEQQLGGAEWQSNISASDVEFTIVQNVSYTTNTGYDPTTNTDVSYPDTDTATSPVQTLEIMVNNVVYFQIKLDCGNPLGQWPTIPKPMVTISGNVYYYNASTNTSTPVGTSGGSNVTLSYNGNTAGTNGGAFSFQVQAGNSFYTRLIPGEGTYTAPSGIVYSDPVLAPDMNPTTYQPPPSPLSCGASSCYENQVANTPVSDSPLPATNYGLVDNTGYDIVYIVSTSPGCPTGETGTPPNCISQSKNFNIIGTTTAQPNTGPAGTPVAYMNVLSNTGSDVSPTITYKVYLTENGNPYPSGTGERASASGTATISPGNANNLQDIDEFDIPTVPAGTIFCEQIDWTPTSTSYSGSTASSEGCFTVTGGTTNYFHIIGTSTASPNTGPVGEVVDWTHTLSNIGNYISPTITYKVYLTENGNPYPSGTGERASASGTDKINTGNANNFDDYDSFIIPNVPAGTAFCEYITWTPTSTSDSDSTSSTPGCFTVTAGVLSGGGEINGEKVDSNGNHTTSDAFDNATVTLVGPEDSSTTDNPFFFNGTASEIPTGSYTVSAANVTGFTVGYSYCTGTLNTASQNCSPNISNPTQDSSFSIQISANEIVNVRWVYKTSGTPVGTGNCPPLNNPATSNGISTEGNASVTITDTTGAVVTASHYLNDAPSGDTTTPGQVWYDDEPTGDYSSVTATDTSIGGLQLFNQSSSEITSSGTTFSNTTGSGTAVVTVNYTPFIKDYPYDNDNVATVNYESDYNEVAYRSNTTPAYFLCSNGSEVGTQGTCPVPATGVCTKTVKGVCTVCSKGTVPTCDYVLDAGSGTPYYAWGAASAPVAKQAPGSEVGPTLPECFDRTFVITPVTVAPQFDDYENPTAITYDGSVPTQYGVVASGDSPIGLRKASMVDDVNLVLVVTVQSVNGTTLGTSHALRFGSTSITGDTYFQPNNGSTTQSFYGNFTGDLTTTLTENDPAGFTVDYAIPADYQIGGKDSQAFQYGDEVCATLEVNPASKQMNAAGTVTVNDGPATTSVASCSKPLAAEPYLKVFGGDVSTGVSTNTLNSSGTEQCNDNTAAPIDTWGDSSSDLYPYAGSGTQLAAFAAGLINGFASAQYVPGSGLSPPPSGLTFANTSGPGSYGGNFSASSSSCSTDYYSQGSTASNVNTEFSDAGQALNNALTSPNGPGDYAYKVNGASTINISDFPSGPGGDIGSNGVPFIPAGYNIVIYSSSAVTMDTNIDYPAITDDLAEMPNLEIITDTNSVAGSNTTGINIDSTVTQLAGIYVAEGTGGIINDCADISDPNNWYSDCGKKLTIDGSLTGTDFILGRTNGSLHEATNTETMGTPSAAEEFDYSPMVWLTYPNQTTAPAIQAITSLPPIL
jgi:hypothetical protein